MPSVRKVAVLTHGKPDTIGDAVQRFERAARAAGAEVVDDGDADLLVVLGGDGTMSSTFVTRLKVGEILVDAKGVSRLFSRRVGLWPFVLFAVAGLMAVVVAILVSPTLRHLIELIGIRLRDLVS